jgi:lipid A 3-O-deacylase
VSGNYRWLGALLSLVVIHAVTCRAQELARSVRVTAENDYFDFWRPPARRSDDNYTQGVRLTRDAAYVPSFAHRLMCRADAACGSALEIGQEIYTPTNDATQPLPGERPYAGWLYLRGRVVEGDLQTRRAIAATLGVTGPASLAAQTQEAFHHLVPGFRRPLGWGFQLPGEPAVALDADETWRFVAPGRAARWADVQPMTHVTVGTLRTALAVGARARLGTALSHPWLQDEHARPWEAYLFLGGRTEAVARDLFLDGSTFRHSVSVERTPLVTQWERGAGVRFRRLGLEYRAVTRGREYRTGPAFHSFGGISLTWWAAR